MFYTNARCVCASFYATFRGHVIIPFGGTLSFYILFLRFFYLSQLFMCTTFSPSDGHVMHPSGAFLTSTVLRGARQFSSPKHPNSLWGTQSLQVHFLMGKGEGGVASDHSPPFSAKVSKWSFRSFTSTASYIFMACTRTALLWVLHVPNCSHVQFSPHSVKLYNHFL
jgi:hypothetical protein